MRAKAGHVVNKKFCLPEDAYIFGTISKISEDYLVGGSVAYHLHTRPEEPMSFKDLDICVGPRFMESVKSRSAYFSNMLAVGSFEETNFDEMGIYSKPRTRHTLNGVEYPAKFWMFLNGVAIDSFVCKTDEIPHLNKKIEGLEVRLMAPSHALKIIESLMRAKVMRNKSTSLQERRLNLLNIDRNQNDPKSSMHDPSI